MKLKTLLPRSATRPAAATAVEQAEARRALLRGVGIEDAGEAQTLAGRLAARATAVRVALERGEMDDAALDEAVARSRELRCLLAAVEARL